MKEKAVHINEKKYRKPKRIFEDSGTVDAEEAYYVHLDNVTNTKKQDIKTMVDRGRYFSIFAPRQSGKTTFLEYLATESAAEGYLVIFDTRTHAGAVCKPREHQEEDKKVTSFIMGIGYREKMEITGHRPRMPGI